MELESKCDCYPGKGAGAINHCHHNEKVLEYPPGPPGPWAAYLLIVGSLESLYFLCFLASTTNLFEERCVARREQ